MGKYGGGDGSLILGSEERYKRREDPEVYKRETVEVDWWVTRSRTYSGEGPSEGTGGSDSVSIRRRDRTHRGR